MTEFKLNEEFINKYKNIEPPFGFNGLGKLVYMRTYSRLKEDGTNEQWWETIRRVVEGTYVIQKEWIINRQLGWNEKQGQRSAQEMYERMFHMKFLPPGRGLWAMGSNIINEKNLYAALNNCAFVSTKDLKDDPTKPFRFLMDMSMLGVGVGFDVKGSGSIKIIGPNKEFQSKIYVIPDTREGWVDSLKKLLESYFYGKAPVIFSYYAIREAGEPIKGFGGVSSGPQPLADLHDAIKVLLNNNIGKLISKTVIVDIMNLIGKCVVSGNVRRTAEIVFGDMSQEYLNLKNYEVNPHRESYGWTSNNSVFGRIGMDYSKIAERIADNGEPGLIWLDNMKDYGRMCEPKNYLDKRVKGANPCFAKDTMIAVADGRNAISIKQLADEGIDVPVYSVEPNTGQVSIKMARNPRLTRKNAKLVKIILDDGSFIKTTLDHKFILLNGDEIYAKDLKPNDSLQRFTKNAEYLDQKHDNQYYRINCNVKNPTIDRIYEHRLIAKFNDKEKWNKLYNKNELNGFTNTSNIIVHHINRDTLDNSFENLDILTPFQHASLHGKENNTGVDNNNYSHITNKQIEEAALQLVSELKRKFSTKEWKLNYQRLGALSEISKFRKNGWFKTIQELSEWAAKESGYNFIHKDPRVIREYNKAIEQGYNIRLAKDISIGYSKLDIEKTCEHCGCKYFVNYSRRGQSFCSQECSLADLAKKKKQKTENEKESRAQKYIKNYIELKKQSNKEPTQKEWRNFCSKINFNGSFSKHAPFRIFSQLQKAANEYNHKVKEIIFLDKVEDVYNLTVDNNHTVGIITSSYKNSKGTKNFSGIFTFQCVEQSLESFELCCLVETFPMNHSDLADYARTLKYAYLYAKTVTLGNTHWPETNRVMLRNRRIGCSVSGIAQFISKNGIDRLKEWLEYGYDTIQNWDNQYSEWLAIPKSIKTTSVKPSGSVSLLAGATPGLHYPESRFYIRRVRIGSNSNLIQPLINAGYHVEPAFGSENDTSVVEIPVDVGEGIRTVKDLSIWEQFSLAAFMQKYWSDNQVSCTITFDPKKEANQILPALNYFQYQLKGISMLPRHEHGAFKQMPYEEITEDIYKEKLSKLKQLNFSNVTDEKANVEKFCDGEFCEIN